MKDKGGIDEQGNYRCYCCDGKVIIKGCDAVSDIYPDFEDEDATLYYMQCSKCGAEYEVIQPSDLNTSGTPMGDEIKLRKEQLKND